MWSGVATALPSYLDSEGLASYFPPGAGDADHGSDALTAYLVSAAHEAGYEWPADAKQRMLDGLARFVDGRIERRTWQPPSLQVRAIDVRKLAALEALSRYGRVTPRMLGSIELAPQVWPTSALIDWYLVLRRVPDLLIVRAAWTRRLATAFAAVIFRHGPHLHNRGERLLVVDDGRGRRQCGASCWPRLTTRPGNKTFRAWCWARWRGSGAVRG